LNYPPPKTKLLAQRRIMKNQNKSKTVENGHGASRSKKKATDCHLPLYCTTDRKSMIIIGLKPLKSAHYSKS